MFHRHRVVLFGIVAAVLVFGATYPLVVVRGQDAPESADRAASALGTAFTYQGNLNKNGQPVDANCSFQFSLWDALTGGTEQGITQIINNTQVKSGVFSVQLDFGNQFTGDERWLQTAVQCAGEGGYTTLSPRQPLNGVPYALGLRPGAVMESAAAGDAFYVEKNAPDSVAIHGKATQEKGTGVLGESESWAGVWGESTGASGVVGISTDEFSGGVYGKNEGEGIGVIGKSSSNTGVYGESDSWAGVWGQSAGASGVVGVSEGEFNGGVYGENTGKGYGVYGKSPNSAGVWGQSSEWIGVYGSSTNQIGVVGESSNHDGVRGTATAANRVGVKGVANANGAVGVWGESDANTGVFGTSGQGTGIWGQSGGTGTIGVKGIADGTDSVGVWGQSAANTGVYGRSGAADGVALWGHNTAGGIGLRVDGNTVQSRNMNGLPKAMAVVNGNTIVRCFNGVTGATTNGCGFSATWVKQGGDSDNGDNSVSTMDFGFNVDDRFIVANIVNPDGIDIAKAFHVRGHNGGQVTLLNWYRTNPIIIGGAVNHFPNTFHIVVY